MLALSCLAIGGQVGGVVEGNRVAAAGGVVSVVCVSHLVNLQNLSMSSNKSSLEASGNLNAAFQDRSLEN
jgi:hypothetical protein